MAEARCPAFCAIVVERSMMATSPGSEPGPPGWEPYGTHALVSMRARYASGPPGFLDLLRRNL